VTTQEPSTGSAFNVSSHLHYLLKNFICVSIVKYKRTISYKSVDVLLRLLQVTCSTSRRILRLSLVALLRERQGTTGAYSAQIHEDDSRVQEVNIGWKTQEVGFVDTWRAEEPCWSSTGFHFQDVQRTIFNTIQQLVYSQYCCSYPRIYCQNCEKPISAGYKTVLLFFKSYWSLEPVTGLQQSVIDSGSVNSFKNGLGRTRNSTIRLILHGLAGPLSPLAEPLLRTPLQDRCGRTWYRTWYLTWYVTTFYWIGGVCWRKNSKKKIIK